MSARQDVVALPNHRCALCGEPNHCVPATTGDLSSACWCSAVTVDSVALSRVPAEQRGLACLCRACATGQTRALPPVDGH
ncbi:MAG: cysteine-rich CWC family protein [Pseudomonadota bacterium]